jgi:hypothetical protein
MVHTLAQLAEALCYKPEVAGSIPVKVINPSSSTVTLGLAQPLTEISTRNFPGGKDRQARKADNFTAICEPIV